MNQPSPEAIKAAEAIVDACADRRECITESWVAARIDDAFRERMKEIHAMFDSHERLRVACEWFVNDAFPPHLVGRLGNGNALKAHQRISEALAQVPR